jgi:hypothetical protein
MRFSAVFHRLPRVTIFISICANDRAEIFSGEGIQVDLLNFRFGSDEVLERGQRIHDLARFDVAHDENDLRLAGFVVFPVLQMTRGMDDVLYSVQDDGSR